MTPQLHLTDTQRTRLTQLEHEGRLNPSEVLIEARSADSPLHSLYNWDMQRAANEHWLDRSRLIIRCYVDLVVTHGTVQLRVPHYVRDPDRAGQQGYVSLTQLRQEPDVARRALEQELRRALGCLRRAREIAAGLGMEDEVDVIIAQLEHSSAFTAATATEDDAQHAHA